MKRDDAKLIAETILKALGEVGLPLDEVLSSVQVAPVDDESKVLLREILLNNVTHDWEQAPDLTPEQLADKLEEIRRIRTTPQVLRKMLREVRKGLPRIPGGPTRRIPLKEETRVCAQVAALLAEGYDRRDAVKHVANKRQASTRTVYRILARHGNTKPRKPRKQR